MLIAVAEVFGWLFLWIPCLCGAIGPADYPSIKPHLTDLHGTEFARPLVDEWSWKWLNPWFANSEDGVSGQQALIYVDANGTLGTYASTFPAWVPKWVIAYCWSAWRNGANNIKRPLRTDGLTKAWP